jgi:nicotinamidase-related amidase
MTPIALTPRSLHICVDMQRMFTEEGPWPTPWVHRILPVVSEIAGRHPQQTIFTRFIPPEHPEQMPGAWQDYYRRWINVTRSVLDPRMLELVPPLAALTPPGIVVDKAVYSPFANPALPRLLADRQPDAVVITGAETDVCVHATVLGAVDRGFRVVVVADAVCSSSDTGHDAMLTIYRNRFSEQIELRTAAEVLSAWAGARPALTGLPAGLSDRSR